MFLQILPPDFNYTSETILVNKAEIISLALPILFLGLFLVYKIVKTRNPKLISEILSVWNFIWAVIKKDLKIN